VRHARLNRTACRQRYPGPLYIVSASDLEHVRPIVEAGTGFIVDLLVRVQECAAVAEAKSAGALLFPAVLTHRNRRPADVAGRVRVGGQELIAPREPSLRGKLNAVELGLEV